MDDGDDNDDDDDNDCARRRAHASGSFTRAAKPRAADHYASREGGNYRSSLSNSICVIRLRRKRHEIDSARPIIYGFCAGSSGGACDNERRGVCAIPTLLSFASVQ